MQIDQKHYAFLDSIVGLAVQKQVEKDPLNQQALNNIHQWRREMAQILQDHQQQQDRQQQKEDNNDKSEKENSNDKVSSEKD